MERKAKQIAINLTGGVAPTLTWGIYRSSVHNTIPSENPHQLYLSFLVIYETDSFQPL